MRQRDWEVVSRGGGGRLSGVWEGDRKKCGCEEMVMLEVARLVSERKLKHDQRRNTRHCNIRSSSCGKSTAVEREHQYF